MNDVERSAESRQHFPDGVELVKASAKDKLKYLPFYAISVLPMRVLYGLSDLVRFVLYHWVKYRREVVAENLKLSFPEKSDTELKAIEKAFYKHFCDLAFEVVKILTMSKKGIDRRFVVKNPELILQYYARERSVMLYMGHYGNWEWFAFLPYFTPHLATSFYQPLSNKYVDKLMKITRCRFGVHVVASHKGYKTILNLHQKNVLTCTMVVGDQSPRPSSTKHWTSFLNRDTAFLTGADRIAMRSDTVVLFPAFLKPKRGVYEIEFVPIEESPGNAAEGAIIDAYANILEKAIRKTPHLWLWSHNRWKMSRRADTDSADELQREHT